MKKLSDLYNISSRGNLRNEVSKGFVRPTVKQVWAPYKKYFNEIISRKLEGGIVTTYTEGQNTYEVHTFLSSGELIVRANTTVDYLIVAGGGAGGYYNSWGIGGGGAGGLLTGTIELNSQIYDITVGNGGICNYSASTNGENSAAFGLEAVGGGHGAWPGYNTWKAGAHGGSGGGGAAINSIGETAPRGTGISGQGHNGGYAAHIYHAGGYGIGGGGGGGGAGSPGGNASGSSNGTGGNGGDGIISSITGQSIYYAGGGGGGGFSVLGYGGLGGGGNPNEDGTPNTGGGGGARRSAAASGNGGSGIVIVRYKI